MTYDLSGQIFGRLKVVSRIERPKNTGHKYVYWKCACECGGEATVPSQRLLLGQTASCGCLKVDFLNRGHGHARRGKKTPTYRSWATMISRCTDPNVPHYDDYGGRGITVCERWKNFENFLADMGERPTGKTLDREENNGNYEPGNCRWATGSEQAFNRRPKRVQRRATA